MSFIITATDGQRYLVHTEVGNDQTAQVIVQPINPNQEEPA